MWMVEAEARVVTEEQAQAMMASQCLRRRILPLDIARVCLFLSTELSDGMTGAWRYSATVWPCGREKTGRYSQSVKSVGLGRRLAVISAAWFCWMLVRAACQGWG